MVSSRAELMEYPVIIIGGTGVFGRYIVDELLASPIPFRITVAARHRETFEKEFAHPPPNLDFCAVDLLDPSSVEPALRGKELAILAAGPFQNLPTVVAELAARLGIHYLDICDDPAYLEKMLALRELFQRSGKTFLSGLSSLPGISLPLASLISGRFDRVEKISIGMFIGNKNQKGRGAVLSAIEGLARPALAIRQGRLQEIESWSEGENYPYPPPIGKVPSYSFNSPDPLIFPNFVPCSDLSVKVAFEWALARFAFSLFNRGSKWGLHKFVKAMAKIFFPFFALGHYFGSERGSVSVILSGSKNNQSMKIRAALVGENRAQKMASLPCVIAAEALAKGEIQTPAVLDLTRWLPPEIFMDRLMQRGFKVLVEEIT